MQEQVEIEKINTGDAEEQLLAVGKIAGAQPVFHCIAAGKSHEFSANTSYYRIFVLTQGAATFATDGEDYTFDGRTSFVPATDKTLTVAAQSDCGLLEIRWDILPEDAADLKAYNTQFPIVVPYQDSIQYIDPNKSEKTISRMMIPHEILPRFTMGSVESYGYDLVRPHAHPMLDQFFYSFAENEMDLIIDDAHYPMHGNEFLHIPLGAAHGVEVMGDNRMHYIWIDFMPDKEEGLKRLNFSHRPTGTVRDFANEDKTR